MSGTVIAKCVRDNATVVEWDDKPISPDRWGKDHWSTIAYAETRAVDHKGVLDGRQMRGRDSGYPTRLKGNTDLLNHGDHDCLKDAEAAGLLVVERGYLVKKNGGRVFKTPDERGLGDNWVFAERVTFTPLGNTVCGLLRAHKANGGNFGSFEWTPAVLVVTDES